jgi:carbonic anhydrase
MADTARVTAADALERLRQGNRRFIASVRGDHAVDLARHDALVTVQAPFATILGCSDARVPAEIIFDQGLGDLFVIRVAGNLVAPSLVGSVEFAATELGSRLVVVIGHTECGAIAAALRAVRQPGSAMSQNLRAIVDYVRPAVDTALEAQPAANDAEISRLAIRGNVRTSASHLRHGSALLERLIRDDGLEVVGAEYDIRTGEVQFFDGELVRGTL